MIEGKPDGVTGPLFVTAEDALLVADLLKEVFYAETEICGKSGDRMWILYKLTANKKNDELDALIRGYVRGASDVIKRRL